jgi:hypothetical protein
MMRAYGCPELVVNCNLRDFRSVARAIAAKFSGTKLASEVTISLVMALKVLLRRISAQIHERQNRQPVPP